MYLRRTTPPSEADNLFYFIINHTHSTQFFFLKLLVTCNTVKLLTSSRLNYKLPRGKCKWTRVQKEQFKQKKLALYISWSSPAIIRVDNRRRPFWSVADGCRWALWPYIRHGTECYIQSAQRLISFHDLRYCISAHAKFNSYNIISHHKKDNEKRGSKLNVSQFCPYRTEHELLVNSNLVKINDEYKNQQNSPVRGGSPLGQVQYHY